MEKYDYWGLDQLEQYEKDLNTVYSLSIKEGYDCAYTEKFEDTLGLYGETNRESVQNFMEYFADYFVDPDGVFYDLGSGIGKLVSHVALGSTLSKVCGIELDKVRHSKAQKLVDSLNFPFSKPDLINDDFLNCNYSDATIIYFDNTMWNDELTEKKDLVFKLFETIRPGVLIISKMEIPHVSCHKKYIRLENSYSDEHGLASIFLSMST